MRTRVKTSQPPKARENASDQIVTGFSFASDWFEKMVRVFWTNHKAKESKVIQSRIIFETSLNLLY